MKKSISVICLFYIFGFVSLEAKDKPKAKIKDKYISCSYTVNPYEIAVGPQSSRLSGKTTVGAAKCSEYTTYTNGMGSGTELSSTGPLNIVDVYFNVSNSTCASLAANAIQNSSLVLVVNARKYSVKNGNPIAEAQVITTPQWFGDLWSCSLSRLSI